MSNHDWSHFERYVEREESNFYEHVDLKPAEYNRVHEAWLEVARGMPREGVVMTMEEHRSIASPIFEACATQLTQRDSNDSKRLLKSEEMDAWASMTPRQIRKLGKRKKRSGTFIERAIKLSNSRVEALDMAA